MRPQGRPLSPAAVPMPAEDRAATGVEGYDAMVSGGFVPGSSNLVAGSPGTGKTTLALHFIAEGIRRGEPAVFVTFEYLPQDLYRDAGRRGWDLKRWEAEGKLRLVCTTPDVLLAETEPGTTVLDQAIREIGARRLVIDSLTHFEFLGKAAHDLRTDLAGLMNRLRLFHVTSVVTHEVPQIVGPQVHVSDWGLEFLVDSVTMLRYVELEGELQKAITVLKFRGGEHDRRYRRVELSARGMTIASDFRDVENVSAGSAHRSVAQRASRLI